MVYRNTAIFIFALFIQAPVFADGLGPAGNDGQSTIDLEPPVIAHDPISGPLKANQTLDIKVRITDDHGVFSATLFYRTVGAKEFRSLAMRLSENDNSVYEVEIPAADISPPKLEYYIQATDVSGNTVLRGGRLFPLSAAVESDFIPLAPTTAAAGEANDDNTKGLHLTNASSSRKTWLWIAGGALVGALVALSNKDSGDSPAATPKGSLTVNFPNPDNPPQ